MFTIGDARPMSLDLEGVGIVTEYRGIRFRSRPEARWAAMFDQFHWSWSYEPIDLSGYVPDFSVAFPGRRPLLIEVKGASLVYDDLQPHAQRICLSGWHGDFLVLGAGPFLDRTWPVLGMYAMWDRESDDGWHPADRAELIDCGVCHRISVRHASAGYRCAACGSDDRAAVAFPADIESLGDSWAYACNVVQWQPAAQRIEES